METKSVVKYINQFRNILTYATNIGFFFGAGSSCAFGLPNITTLTDDTRSRLDKDNQVLFDKVKSSLKVLSSFSNVTVEHILNYIRKIRDITNGRSDYSFDDITGLQAEELDKKICTAIFDIIKEKEESADISYMRRFISWYDSANRGFIKEIYTTNYDMIIEMALEANYTPYFDGFTGSYEPFFSPESIDSFPTENDSTSKWIRLWKIHGSLNWMKKNASVASNSRIIRIGKIEHPSNELMIYPSQEKYNLSRREPFVAYFDRLKKYLQRGECVFICSGYSFSDEHINDIFFNALKQNNRLYIMVFCFSDEQVNKLSKYAKSYMNLCVMGPTRMISNCVEYKWQYDGTEDDDLGYKSYWNEPENKFTLGDFKALVDFLIENSGRKSIIEEIANAK